MGKAFPTFLNSSEKQGKRARKLVEDHLGEPTKSARPVRIQGMYSRTFIVTLKANKREVIIQLRYEPLDVSPFVYARQVLGDVVPVPELLKDEELEAAEFWPVYMNRIPGTTWLEVSDRWDPQLNVTVGRSLGKALSRGFVPGDSPLVVKETVLPKLQKLLASTLEPVIPFRDAIRGLINDVHQLDRLPLLISHLDLNEMNIMVTETGEVSGIIDWELSPPPRPFGIGCSRLHDLAGEFHDGKFVERENYQDIERGFWEEISGNAPKDVKKILDNNPQAIQTSFMIGTVLRILDADKEDDFSKPSLGALPKFLTYRIPALRGADTPYANV